MAHDDTSVDSEKRLPVDDDCLILFHPIIHTYENNQNVTPKEILKNMQSHESLLNAVRLFAKQEKYNVSVSNEDWILFSPRQPGIQSTRRFIYAIKLVFDESDDGEDDSEEYDDDDDDDDDDDENDNKTSSGSDNTNENGNLSSS